MIRRFCDQCAKECVGGWFELTLKERESEKEYIDAMKCKRLDQTLCKSCALLIWPELEPCQHPFWTDYEGIRVCNDCQMTIDPRE